MQTNIIYNEDCFEVMARMEDKSIDAIITDPPYLFIKGGESGDKVIKFSGGMKMKDTYIGKKMSDFDEKHINMFLNSSFRILKKINYYIFCSELQIQFYLAFATKNKLRYNLLVWDKGNRNIMQRKAYSSTFEYIIRIYEKGVSLIPNNNNNYYCKYKSHKSIKETIHHTEKPIPLICEFIELSTKPKSIVFDPFLGSGTTAIACNITDRQYIGCEIDQEYYKIAINRIEKSKTMFD